MTSADLAQLIIGDSTAIRSVRNRIARVAASDLPVLVQGPTGVGKELVARAIHAMSGRRGKLVAFNVCAIPAAMFEAALFGHRRGAFTGAITDNPGLLAEAHEGTAFFDEIGGLSSEMQPKLLRAIEHLEFRPIGAPVDRRSDFRVVAASNVALEALVRQGHFRADLSYRLAGVVIEVPALAQRPEDVPMLARYFLQAASLRHGRPAQLTDGALSLLERQPWPGNVRELRLTVERALVLAPMPRIDRQVIAEALTPLSGRVPEPELRASSACRQFIDVLESVNWDTARAAVVLGINRTTVYRRMKRFGIVGPHPSSGTGLPGNGSRHTVQRDGQPA